MYKIICNMFLPQSYIGASFKEYDICCVLKFEMI